LEWYLRTQQLDLAKKEHARLVTELEGKTGVKSAKRQIRDHFKRVASQKFTRSKARETKFISGLTNGQKRIYNIAKKNSRALPKQIREITSGSSTAP
jgi:hypothetical protein